MFVEIIIFVTFAVLWLFLSNRRPAGFPPGPTGLPIVGYLPFIKVNPHDKFQEFSKKYGNILGIQLGQKWVVVLNDHESLREAFKNDAFSGRPKFPLALLRSEGRKEGVVLSEGREWQEQRRFTMRHLRDFGFGRKSMEELIKVEVQEVVDILRENVGKPTDLRLRFNLAVINALWYIATGEKFSYDDPKLRKLFEDMFTFTKGENFTLQTDLFYPWLVKLRPSVYNVREFIELSTSILHLCEDSMKEHKKAFLSESPRDFIDVYLTKIQSESDPDSSFFGKKGENSLGMVLSDLFGAGSETTSTTLYWIFLFMVVNPEIQRKVQEEIDKVVGRSRFPSLQDRQSMPYTEAVIAETLRHSSIALLGVFHSTMEDTVLRGYKIPKDTVIIPNIYAANYNSQQWDSPEEFRPERFLTSEGTLKTQDAVVSFGIGKRACLGETLARAELFLFITGLLQNFTFASPPEEVPSLKPNVTFLRQAKTYHVILQER